MEDMVFELGIGNQESPRSLKIHDGSKNSMAVMKAGLQGEAATNTK